MRRNFVRKLAMMSASTVMVATALMSTPAAASGSFTWTYNANGGGGTMTQSTTYSTCGSKALTTSYPPTRSGFKLIGWSLGSRDGEFLGSGNYTNCTNITLFAQWNYSVTFDANGGSASTPSATNAASGVVLPNASREGFDFTGWHSASIGGARVGGPGDIYNPNNNVTVFAQWASPTFTVTYNANGGSPTPPTASFTVGDPPLTLPNPNRSGYSFNGWYTASTGGNLIGTAGATYTPTETTTLHARWTSIPLPPSPPPPPGPNFSPQAPDTILEMTDLAMPTHEKPESPVFEMTSPREELLAVLARNRVLRVSNSLIMTAGDMRTSRGVSVRMKIHVQQRNLQRNWRKARANAYRVTHSEDGLTTIRKLIEQPLRVRITWTMPAINGETPQMVTRHYRIN